MDNRGGQVLNNASTIGLYLKDEIWKKMASCSMSSIEDTLANRAFPVHKGAVLTPQQGVFGGLKSGDSKDVIIMRDTSPATNVVRQNTCIRLRIDPCNPIPSNPICKGHVAVILEDEVERREEEGNVIDTNRHGDGVRDESDSLQPT